MKKKIVTLLLVAAMTGTMVVGCGSKADDKTADTKTEQTDDIPFCCCVTAAGRTLW